MTNQYIDGREAMRRMEEWGAQKKPFLFLIDFEGTECQVLPLDEIDPEELRYDFRGVTNWTEQEDAPFPPLEWKPKPEAYETYRQSFDYVFEQLHAGNSFLTNLTVATPVRTNWTLRQIFRAARAPCLWCFRRRSSCR